LDLVDSDFDVKVWNITYHFTVFMEDTQNSKLWGESIHVPAVCIKLKDSQNRFFRWSDISEFVDRLILFLGEEYEIIINWPQDDYNKLEEFLDTYSSEEYYVMEIIIYKKLDY
jgi:pantothenate kinase-related protein Tda10